MRILILFKKWPGGVGSVVKYIKKEFEKKGHKVETISREDDLKIFSLRKSLFLLRKIIKERDFDVIYTQDWSMAFPLLFPTPLFRKKHFCVFYGETPYRMGKYFQKIVGNIMGKRLVVCADHLKEMFKKANLIYNRVDHNTFKPNNNIKKIKNSVGFASWVTDKYHYHDVKKAVQNAGKRFILAENIPKEKMPDFYRKLEIFINLPPKYSGFGLVYLEAMASGVPKIIGHNYGGGNVLPITKIKDYGGNIKKAILKVKEKDYRKWILDKKFTWEDAVEKLENLFIGLEYDKNKFQK